MFNSGRVTEAAEAFKKAIEADATYADAYYQLGMCLSGNPDTMAEAIRVLKKYLEIGKQADQLEVSKQLIATLEETMKKK
jgi:tetratricopeptide (TPR) repeat protein